MRGTLRIHVITCVLFCLLKGAAGAPRSLGVLPTLAMWGDDVGPAPHPSLNHFFLEKRNGLEIQRKSLSLAVAVCLVVLFGGAGIVLVGQSREGLERPPRLAAYSGGCR